MVKSVFAIILSLIAMAGVVACGGSSGGSTGAVGSDEGAPRVLAVVPGVNNNAVPVDTTIAATFDSAMNAGTVSSFVVHGSQTGQLAGGYSGGGTTTLGIDTFNRNKTGEEIDVTLTGALTSVEGLPLAHPFIYRFRTETVSGPGRFVVSQKIDGQYGASDLIAGDLDGDGDIDMAVANSAADTVALFRNDGSGRFSEAGLISNQPGARALAAGDWDGDGDLDSAVAELFGPTGLTC